MSSKIIIAIFKVTNLSGHDPLPFSDKVAFAARAIPESAMPLVSF